MEFQEFFVPHPDLRRTGAGAHWLGPAAKMLQLTNPVELIPFRHLLKGLSPDGSKQLLPETRNPEHEMAWRVDFHSSNGLNTLWALSSRPTRLKIEQAHRRAAREAIAAVEIVVTDASPEQTAEKGPTALFAAFRGGGYPDRLADLRTTAFLFNLKFHPNGEVSQPSHRNLKKKLERFV